jgi:hypothetical protein
MLLVLQKIVVVKLCAESLGNRDEEYR